MSKNYRRKINIHDFYCINCGKKGITLPRKDNKRKGKFHRKKLYCLNCGFLINHVEICNTEEYWEFQEMFESGNFKEEAEQSKELSAQKDIFQEVEVNV